MSSLNEQLEAARAEVARLERQIIAAPCHEVGHRWVQLGGANCGCEDGGCSVPVMSCKVCGDCDYGINEEATEIRAECAAGSDRHWV